MSLSSHLFSWQADATLSRTAPVFVFQFNAWNTMPAIQRILQCVPLLVLSSRERLLRRNSRRPEEALPLGPLSDRSISRSISDTSFFIPDPGRSRDVSSFLIRSEEGGQDKKISERWELKKKKKKKMLMRQICDHRELSSKSDLRNSLSSTKGEILREPCVRRATFRTVQASSGDCRFFQRSICLWPVPSPSSATGIGEPTTHSSRIYAITAPFSTLYVAGAHCPQLYPRWSFLFFF